jgi:hypothetical protein
MGDANDDLGPFVRALIAINFDIDGVVIEPTNRL